MSARKLKGLMQLLSGSLCRGAREKVGFNDEDGWIDGGKWHTHSDRRGQRTPDANPRPPPHGGRSPPQAIPLCGEGNDAVGPNRGPSDGAHGVQRHSTPVCPWKPCHGMGVQRTGASSESCSGRLHSPQHKHSHAYVSLLFTLRCHTAPPISNQSVSCMALCYGKKQLIPF